MPTNRPTPLWTSDFITKIKGNPKKKGDLVEKNMLPILNFQDEKKER